MITTNAFYKEKACRQYSQAKRVIPYDEVGRYATLHEMIKSVVLLLGKDSAESVREQVGEWFNELEYDSRDFPFPWQAQTTKGQDAFVFKRFLDWYISEKFETVKVAVSCAYKDICTTADIICKKGQQYYAFILKWREDRYSSGGRSELTKLTGSLDLLLMKNELEGKYPGIITGFISLMSQGDKSGILAPLFAVTSNKKSNLYSCNLLEALGTWDKKHKKCLKPAEMSELEKQMDKMLEASYPEKKCADCFCSDICNAPVFEQVADIEAGMENAREYKLPKYSKEQLSAVEHKDGPLLICAGPGSGKTAVLTGRCLALKEKGVNMQNVLLITFTNKAAGELQRRLSGMLGEDEMPSVMTLNGLGNKILTDNWKLVGKHLKTATDVDILKLLFGVANSLPQVTGVSYNSIYGRYGLLATLRRWFAEYDKEGDYFFEKNPEVDANAFLAVKWQFETLMEAKGYITFDQQISEAVKLLLNQPGLLSMYRSVYRYIMVDEFQDIDENQARLIYALAGKGGNLCVVGDDDQSIYGFRGGTNAYMVHFTEVYQDALVVKLATNYRSQKPILDLAAAVIDGNGERIEKQIVPVKQDTNDLPILRQGVGLLELSEMVDSLHKTYAYGDIAILALRNNEISEIRKNCSFPSKMSKTYLREDSLFLSIFQILSIVVDKSDRSDVVKLCCEMAADNKHDILSGQCTVDCLNSLEWYDEKAKAGTLTAVESSEWKIVQACEACRSFKTEIAEAIPVISEILFGVTEHSTVSYLTEQIELRKIMSIYELWSYMSDMINFEDETRIDYFSKEECVELLTDHDSKGKEFPVVIIWKAENFKTDSESKRLFYVAVTRAEEKLIVCSSNEKVPNVLKECLEYVDVI